MMDHNDYSKSPSSSGGIDMRHLIKPRGRGYSLRMLTSHVLVGTENPCTAKPFGKEIKLGLDTRSHAEALRIRDVRVGQIRQLEADAIAASGRVGIGRILAILGFIKIGLFRCKKPSLCTIVGQMSCRV